MFLLSWLFGCAEAPMSVEIPVRGSVGGEDFACGRTYDGIGTRASSIEALDFRFYVHDVQLVTADGEAVNVDLEQDGRWQYEGVALVDLEDGTGACATGSPETHATVTGTVPAGDYEQLSFRLGVPAPLNHIDAATAPAPLNDPGLWWAWTSGYKYARLDVSTATNPAFYFHLGATNCAEDGAGDYACNLDNLAAITLDGFEPGVNGLAIDLADFYDASDLDATPDFVSDFVSGCMAFPGDPECGPLFERIGMGWEGAASSEQSFFQVVTP